MMSEWSTELESSMAKIVPLVGSGTGIDKTLPILTAAACANLVGVHEASITMLAAGGSLETLAPTSDRARDLDDLQYRFREGPCYETVIDDVPTVSNSVGSDVRWPQYGPAAARLGIHSQLAFELWSTAKSKGALNLSSEQADAFGGDHELLTLFAIFAATLLGYAREVDGLTRALDSRADIARGVGVVMQRYGLDETRAFEFLVRLSQSRNTKLRDVAQLLTSQVAGDIADDLS